jgi:hypothetical protein
MPTIIDSLVVTLGLKVDPYHKGRVEAEREQAKLSTSVKKGSNQIGEGIAEVGRQVATLVLGFESLRGAVGFFAGLNVASANLGRFSKNLGESAHEVNAWDSAVELAGGSAKDAEADLMALSNSITALKATGDVSPLILLFQRMGVSIYDAQGRTRKLTDLYKDLGDRLRQYNRADAFNLAKQAGISDSTFNLIRAEASERQRLLDTAERNNAVTDASVQKAAQLQEEWRQIGQEVKALGQTILEYITPAVKTVFEYVKGLTDGWAKSGEAAQRVSAFFQPIADVLKLIVSGWSQLIDLIKGAVQGDGVVNKFFVGLGWLFDKLHVLAGGKSIADSGTPAAVGAPQDAAARRAARNNPGNLRFAGQAGATNSEGFAAFPTLAQGIQAANRQLDLYAQRGVNTIGKIVAKWAPPNENDVPAYIAALKKATGKGENDELSAFDRQRLLQGIFGHEGSNKVAPGAISSILGNPGALDAARFANTQAVPESNARGNRSSVTTVDIDTINVNAPNATNAKDIAAELPGALQRKGVVAQADSGMS